MPTPNEPLALTPEERRVLGVMIEKGLTTPEQCPLTLNALVTGCNQKSNREPVTSYDDVLVEATIESLIRKGLAVKASAASGRVERWRQNLGMTYELPSVELGVIGELLLRGPQTVGELRARASRMRPIADLAALDAILAKLRASEPPFVVRLSEEGAVRGARVTHALYPPAELAQVRAAEDSGAARSPAPAAPRATDEPDLRERVAALEARVQALEARWAAESGASG